MVHVTELGTRVLLLEVAVAFALPPHQTCTGDQGKDIGGSNVYSFSVFGSASERTQECCQACTAHPTCQGWTVDNNPSKDMAWCWLKRFGSQSSTRHGNVRGMCEGLNQDMGGHDISSSKTAGTQAQKDAACCAACKASDDCDAWVQATNGNSCWLKKLSNRNARRNSGKVSGRAPLPSPSKKYRPLVLMHGMGATNDTQFPWQGLEIQRTYPGIYVKALAIDQGPQGSLFKPMEPQIQHLAEAVRSDPELQEGFNIHGESQGGLLARAYVQRFNSPRVHRLISICGPQAGVGQCPASIPIVGKYKQFCAAAAYDLQIYHWPLSFAGYWKDVTNGQQNYLKNSVWLADLNNERLKKNETYKENMLKLDLYYTAMASHDTIVRPRESALHQFWAWDDKTRSKIVPLAEDDGFAGDWIGLKTLKTTGRLTSGSFQGEHTGYGLQWFRDNLLSLYNDQLSGDSKANILV